MFLIENQKPKESWADFICQDQVVAHPENLIWVFRRSHVGNNSLRFVDWFGLDGNAADPNQELNKSIVDIVSSEIQDIISWLFKWDLPGLPGPGTNTSVCLLQNGPPIYKASFQVLQNNQNSTQYYQLVQETPTETPGPGTTQQ